MDLQTFVATNHRPLDNGLGGYSGECVSLDWQYAYQVQHVPLGVLYCSNTGGARDLYEQFDRKLPDYYIQVSKEDLKPGDIVVWGSAMGKYGHTAVKIDGPDLTVFEQMAGVSPRVHRYTNLNGVLGGLRLKEGDSMNQGDLNNAWDWMYGHPPTAADLEAWLGKPFKDLSYKKFRPELMALRQELDSLKQGTVSRQQVLAYIQDNLK